MSEEVNNVKGATKYYVYLRNVCKKAFKIKKKC